MLLSDKGHEASFGCEGEVTRRWLRIAALFSLVAGAAWLALREFDQPQAIRADENSRLHLATRNPLAHRLQIEAYHLSRRLPIQIEDNVVLERVAANGLTVVYDYRLQTEQRDEAKIRQLLEDIILPQTCLGRLRNSVRIDNVTYLYRYRSETFDQPLMLRVNESLCRERFGD